MSDWPDSEGPIVKACRDCGQIKPITEFHTSPRRKYGRGSYCQPCFNERSKKSYAKRVLEKQGREVRAAVQLPDGHRHCPDCGKVLPLEDFPRNKNGRSGYGSYCKPCHNKRGRDSRIKNHGGSRNYHLKARYKINEQEFHGILLAQRGGCGICGAPDPEHVDHDHVTGQVRGILCFNCNGGLGQFKDNIATMRNAIDYLKETSWQRVLVHPGVFRLRSPRRACLPSRSS
jgi:Recombination endonuclease VII